MEFVFGKNNGQGVDDTTRTMVDALGMLSGSVLNIALFELSARRPFEVVMRRRGDPCVLFLSRDDAAAFQTSDGHWATCAWDTTHLTIEATTGKLQLKLVVDVAEDGVTLGSGFDFELSGSAVQPELETSVIDALQAGIGVPLTASRLVLTGLEELVALAERSMWAKAEVLRGARTAIDQDTGVATIGRAQGITRCNFTVLGTWSAVAGSWLWGWANNSIDTKFVERLNAVRALGQSKGVASLVESSVPGLQQDAQRLAAVAVQVIGAEAVATLRTAPSSLMYVGLFGLHSYV